MRVSVCVCVCVLCECVCECVCECGAIFGGEIDETVSNIRFYYYEFEEYPTIGDLFNYLINVNIDDTNSGSSISSTPNHVCRCINGQPDCSDPI